LAGGDAVKIGLLVSAADSFPDLLRSLPALEAAGLDRVLVPEAYTFDSVSRLGAIAVSSTALEIATGVMNVYSRSPALIAMTAAGLDAVSGGRFILGLGASGQAVIEGFHALPYAAPLQRTREVIEICRTVWRREPLSYDGKVFQVPLPAGPGGPPARPLRLVERPVRPAIPVYLAALGPRNVELAAELADGWLPTLYRPESAAEVFGAALAKGAARRPATLGPLEIAADVKLMISDDPDELEYGYQRVREYLALYVGGMGTPGQNFYQRLVRRYGFEPAAAQVEELYRAGRKEAAAAAVPGELLRTVSLVGPRGFVAERVAALRESGVTGINAAPVAPRPDQRIADIAALKELAR
jgi:F420-dependent oxidoreductase-like protein